MKLVYEGQADGTDGENHHLLARYRLCNDAGRTIVRNRREAFMAFEGSEERSALEGAAMVKAVTTTIIPRLVGDGRGRFYLRFLLGGEAGEALPAIAGPPDKPGGVFDAA